MKKSYHIAIVGGCLSSHGGGAPRSMAQQARALIKNSCQVTLFAGKNSHFPYTPRELDIASIPSHVSPLWGPSVLGFFPQALYALWKTAPQLNLIHLNGAWNLTTWIAARIARHHNVPYIISGRSHYGAYHFSRMPLIKKIIFQLMEKSNLRHAHALHLTTDWEIETSQKAVKYAPRIVKIPNPVNLTDFTPAPSRHQAREILQLPQDSFLVLHLGRLGSQKNLSFLIQAFHRAQLPSTARLLLIGPPEKSEKARLKKQIYALNLQHQITFINFAKGRERVQWFAAADLFTLPSHDENFCIAAIEAAASGTHSLLSPTVGAIEYLDSSLITVETCHLDAWSQQLRKHAQNPYPQQPENPAHFDHFSVEIITRQWLSYYSKITS